MDRIIKKICFVSSREKSEASVSFVYMKKTSVALLLILMSAVIVTAQSIPAPLHKPTRRHHHVKTEAKQNAEEKKKAAIQRTLKEKGFHMPDTSHKK
jgi:hypothetical protein